MLRNPRKYNLPQLGRRIALTGMACLTATTLGAGTFVDMAMAEVAANVNDNAPALVAGTGEVVSGEGTENLNAGNALTTQDYDGDEDSYSLSYYSMRVSDVELGTEVNADSLNLRVYDYDWDYDALEYGTDYKIAGYYTYSDYYSYDYDYDGPQMLDGAPTEVGEYVVEVEGVGSYHGTLHRSFEIYDQYDLSRFYSMRVSDVLLGTEVNADSLNLQVTSDYDYDYDYDALEYGTDYKIAGYYTYSDYYGYDYDYDGPQMLDGAPTEVGEYVVEVEGVGSYHGTLHRSFEIYDQYDLSRFRAKVSNPDSGIEVNNESLELVVYNHDDEPLVYGTDYKIAGYYTYDEYYSYDYDYDPEGPQMLDGVPTEPGSYVVELVGLDPYEGVLHERFEIVDQYDITNGYGAYAGAVLELGAKPTGENLDLTVYRYSDDYDYDGERQERTYLEYGKDYKITGVYDYGAYYAYYDGDYDYDYDGDKIEPEEPQAITGAIKDAGNYVVTIEGINAYHGILATEFYAWDSYNLEAEAGWRNHYYLHAYDVEFGKAVNAKSLGLYVEDYDYDDDGDEVLLSSAAYKFSGYYNYDDYYYNYDENGDPIAPQKLSAAPTAIGHYVVEVEGVSPYYGKIARSFSIFDPYDLDYYSSGYSIEYDEDNGHRTATMHLCLSPDTIDGESKTLTLDKDIKVVGWYNYENDDYDYDYDGSYYDESSPLAGAPSKPGEYVLLLEGISPYYGTKTVFVDLDENLTAPISLELGAAKDYRYATGAEYKQTTSNIAAAEALIAEVESGKKTLDKATLDALKAAVAAAKSAQANDSLTGGQASALSKALATAKSKAAVKKKSQTVTVKKKTVTVKAKALKKKAAVVKAAKVTKGNSAKTKITYTKVKANKSNGKFKVAKTGKITIKKGLKKGTYKLTVKATAAASSAYKGASKTFVVKIRVK